MRRDHASDPGDEQSTGQAHPDLSTDLSTGEVPDLSAGENPEQVPEQIASLPRLDADGMIAADGSPPREPAPLAGPSALLPTLVAAAGAALTVLTAVETVRSVPGAGEARPMNELVLAAALALGGYSLTRLLQLLLLAGARARDRSAGRTLAEVRWRLLDEHSLHAVWVIGVGASIGLMGLLGVWSLLDGHPSGLEPGWPLLLVGGGTALLAHLARQRTSRAWQEAGDTA